MKAGKLFSVSAWGAVALAISSMAVADTAAAQERDRSSRQINERRSGAVDRAGQRPNREMRTYQARPIRNDSAAVPRGGPSAQAVRPQPPARQGMQGGAQVAQERQRGERSWNRGDSGSRGTGWNRGDSGERQTWNRGEDRREYASRDRDNDRRSWQRDRDNDQRSWQRDRDDRRNDWRNDRSGSNGDRNDWRGDNRRASQGNYRNWDRSGWRRDNRYDWQSYRARNRSVYRIGRYYAPYNGYAYRRLSIGFSLGSMFYGNRYWINDPWSYRLPQVYGPYRWVRYYDDVLLVDIYSGQVVDVIYDFFW